MKGRNEGDGRRSEEKGWRKEGIEGLQKGREEGDGIKEGRKR